MTPRVGDRLGSVQIVAPLGAGGMGEVYQARDTRLGRDVALKILPEAFAGTPTASPASSARRRLLASLNHPNIAQIYGVEDVGGTAGAGHGAGARARRWPRSPGDARPIAAARRAADRTADRRGARGRARARHRPSRSEAGEHQSPRRRQRQGARLRAGESDGSASRGRAGDALRLADDDARRRSRAMGVILGTAGVHVARAGARAGRSTSAPTSGRSASCSSRCSPDAGCSTARRVSDTLARCCDRTSRLGRAAGTTRHGAPPPAAALPRARSEETPARHRRRQDRRRGAGRGGGGARRPRYAGTPLTLVRAGLDRQPPPGRECRGRRRLDRADAS